MKLLRDFRCESCNAEFERYIDSEITQVICNCGQTAKRMIGMPRVELDGTDPAFPTAWDKWAKKREQNHRVAAKRGRQ